MFAGLSRIASFYLSFGGLILNLIFAASRKSKQHPSDPMKVAVVITNGTNDPLKCEIGILCGFTALKQGHDVTYILMGEAGSVIDDEILRNCNGFGLPPMAKLLDDEVMQKAEWYAA